MAMKCRMRDSFLTLLGIAGLLVYVLACRPSFSPDGTKVVFPVVDNKARRTSIVLYDIKRKTLETMAVFASTKNTGEDKDEVLAYSVQWLPPGQHVLVNGISLIMTLAVGSQSPARILTLDEKLDAGSLILPPPMIGNHQFLISKIKEQERDAKGEMLQVEKPALMRINLQTWETKFLPIRLECSLFSNGTQLFYSGQIHDGDQKAYEIGRLDMETGTQTALLQLKEKEYGELDGFVSLNRAGDRFAIGSLYQDEIRIVLIRGNSVEKMIPVTAKGSPVKIGNMEWSADEKSLYAAYTREVDKDGNIQFGVLEVPLNGGSTHEMPLFTGKLSDDDLLYFPIALSPDGRRIAASSLSFGSDEEIQPQDRALYLVDLSSSKWKVVKVAVPLPSPAKTEAGKK
jgi:hypothetical protein